MASPISRLFNIWTIRVAIALLALSLALTLEWLRPDGLTRLDEGLRDNF